MDRTVDPDSIPRIRQWNGVRLSAVDEVLMFHDRADAARETFRRLIMNLDKTDIGYVFVGSMALAAHNHRSVTPDIQACVRPHDLQRFRKRFLGREYEAVEGRPHRCYDAQTQVSFDLIASGELAGRRSRNKVIRFPDPSEAEEIGGLRTVSLGRLSELKLVTWRMRDWADVIDLIRANDLDEAFADKIDPLVRMAYLECYDHKVDEDRYEREAGGF